MAKTKAELLAELEAAEAAEKGTQIRFKDDGTRKISFFEDVEIETVTEWSIRKMPAKAGKKPWLKFSSGEGKDSISLYVGAAQLTILHGEDIVDKDGDEFVIDGNKVSFGIEGGLPFVQ